MLKVGSIRLVVNAVELGFLKPRFFLGFLKNLKSPIKGILGLFNFV